MLTSLRLFTRAPCTRIKSWLSAPCSAGDCASVLVAMLIASPSAASAQQVGDAFRWAREDRAVAQLHDWPLQQLRVLRQGGEQLVVGQLALTQGELRVGGLAGAQDVARPQPGLPQELADLRLRQWLDVVVHAL